MAQISHSNVLDKPYSALSFPSRYLSLTDIFSPYIALFVVNLKITRWFCQIRDWFINIGRLPCVAHLSKTNLYMASFRRFVMKIKLFFCWVTTFCSFGLYMGFPSCLLHKRWDSEIRLAWKNIYEIRKTVVCAWYTSTAFSVQSITFPQHIFVHLHEPDITTSSIN